MRINGIYYQSITPTEDGIKVLDQRYLPWRIEFVELNTAENAKQAIREMWVRGAPLIGSVGAFGLAFALRNDSSDEGLEVACQSLAEARPTAINLRWAIEKVRAAVQNLPPQKRAQTAMECAWQIAQEDARLNYQIGQHGLELLCKLTPPDRPLQILTHCNAGWIATMDYGTALSPIYQAHDAGMPLHVWVDETRPRNQGSLLTAFELAQHGVPHTVITDNAGGLLMQRGQVDVCIVGADRVTRNGDVCNKIGTYLKALAAFDNAVPFYVAFPYSTYDPSLECGSEIPIEQRSGDEITWLSGPTPQGQWATVQTTPSSVQNPAFDITPARLVSGYLTELGLMNAQQLRERYAGKA